MRAFVVASLYVTSMKVRLEIVKADLKGVNLYIKAFAADASSRPKPIIEVKL